MISTELKPGARLRFYGKTSNNGAGIREYLAARVPFVAGTMTAFKGITQDMGQAPSEVRSEYARMAPHIVYTVTSYRTPIAWVTTDGAVTIPDARYSVTTSRHQGTLWALRPAPAPVEVWVFHSAPEYAPRGGVVSITTCEHPADAERLRDSYAGRVHAGTPYSVQIRPAA